MKKAKYIIVCILVMLLLPIKLVYATDDICTVKLTPSSSSINVGDTVRIDVKIDELYSDKVTVLSGKIKYDTNIFEPISASSFSVRTPNFISNPSVGADGTKEDGIRVVDTLSPVQTPDTTMVSITMKVKSDAVFTGDSTVIQIINGNVSDGTNDQPFSAQTTLQLKTAEPSPEPSPDPVPSPSPSPDPEPSPSPSPDPEPSPSPSPDPEPSQKPSPTRQPATSPSNGQYGGAKLPQTGVGTIGIIAVTSIGVIASGIALFKYIGYKKILK